MTHKKIVWVLFLAACIGVACNHSPRPSKENLSADTVLMINNKQILMPEDRKNIYAEVDISPMDMSYFPPKYPQQKMSNPEMKPPVMRIIYSRPHLQGRSLFPDILQYGQPWRLGANEATELQVFTGVRVMGNKLPPGRYTLHCIPQEKEWKIVFNRTVDVWGLQFDTKNDLFDVAIPVMQEDFSVEYFTMIFEEDGRGANLVMRWGNAVAKLPFTF